MIGKVIAYLMIIVFALLAITVLWSVGGKLMTAPSDSAVVLGIICFSVIGIILIAGGIFIERRIWKFFYNRGKRPQVL